MTVTSVGWRGSVGESEIAEILTLAGVRSSVKSDADWKPTAVAGNRQLAIAAGTGYAAFIRSFSDESVVLNFDAPLAGQWHVIVNRRTWSDKSAVFMALPGPTTSTATPVRPPLVFPAEFQDEPGEMFDQEICWAWVNAGSTLVRIWDMREPPLSVRMPPAHGFMSDGPQNSIFTFPDFIADSGTSVRNNSLPVIQPSGTPRSAEVFTPVIGGIRMRQVGLYSVTLRYRLEFPAVARSFAQLGIAGLGYRTNIDVGEDIGMISVNHIPIFEPDVVLDINYYIQFGAVRRIIEEQRLSITYHGPNGS
ncbi:hypothetical protein [Agreia sp. COWG]|uniref:hypothetical protein n=1 Tax=Agreia sp. COWG TaxID=2773266 RepID=UPI00192716B4|nr:hypothetical protein [Agreia sp. COWG]CAD5999186.1 protein of unknown function [Agreia sp. COWG]